MTSSRRSSHVLHLVLAFAACTTPEVIGTHASALTADGDLNGDGTINSLDLQLEVNVLLGSAQNAAADVNHDAAVNALDLQTLVNLILNPTGTYPPGPYGTDTGLVLPNYQFHGYFAPKNTSAPATEVSAYVPISMQDLRATGARYLLWFTGQIPCYWCDQRAYALADLVRGNTTDPTTDLSQLVASGQLAVMGSDTWFESDPQSAVTDYVNGYGVAAQTIPFTQTTNAEAPNGDFGVPWLGYNFSNWNCFDEFALVDLRTMVLLEYGYFDPETDPAGPTQAAARKIRSYFGL